MHFSRNHSRPSSEHPYRLHLCRCTTVTISAVPSLSLNSIDVNLSANFNATHPPNHSHLNSELNFFAGHVSLIAKKANKKRNLTPVYIYSTILNKTLSL